MLYLLKSENTHIKKNSHGAHFTPVIPNVMLNTIMLNNYLLLNLPHYLLTLNLLLWNKSPTICIKE